MTQCQGALIFPGKRTRKHLYSKTPSLYLSLSLSLSLYHTASSTPSLSLYSHTQSPALSVSRSPLSCSGSPSWTLPFTFLLSLSLTLSLSLFLSHSHSLSPSLSFSVWKSTTITCLITHESPPVTLIGGQIEAAAPPTALCLDNCCPIAVCQQNLAPPLFPTHSRPKLEPLYGMDPTSHRHRYGIGKLGMF